ncbi:MAG TPA: cytochrome c3 family protein [Candidatus Binatia bacterium]|nr:cytochrome c3 family protein [Candidatus Binatia bacterium]
MRWAATIVLLFACAGMAAAQDKVDSCVTCHSALTDQLGAPVAGMPNDVHSKHGFSCADCHGGDPTIMDLTAMAPETGFRGKPKRRDIPDLCGRCHSDAEFMRRYNPGLPTNQRERYWTSVHGKRLAAGDEKVATCISCHGVHGIISGHQADSPVYRANVPSTCGHCHSDAAYMAEYKIPATQETQYRTSVHGVLLLEKRDLGAPTCATCHDNHGASPPGTSSIAEVCGQCHVNNATFFIASPHKTAFDRLNLPECVTCHGNHGVQRTSDAMLGVGDGALCGTCHTSDSKGYREATAMRQTIDRLKGDIEHAESQLERAEQLGMEVSDTRYEFRNARALLIQARTGVHHFSATAVDEVAKPGFELAQRTGTVARAALAEAYARRRNLIFPLAIIAVVMILLAIKLRRIERAPPRANE